MVIESKLVEGEKLNWILRCPTSQDAYALAELRLRIDGETENLDREAGEGVLKQGDFEELIYEDSVAERRLFLVAEVAGKIVGFARCEGNKLSRFRHKAEFGIGILKEYWGFGIGKEVIRNILIWADSVGIEKVSLTVVETNTKAILLYKSFGFKEEGLLVMDRKHRDGNYYNTVIMGRLI